MDQQTFNVLGPKPRWVCVRRITQHSIVNHIRRVSDCIAPERLSLNLEVGDLGIGDVRQGEGDGTAVTVFLGAVGIVGPPGLCTGVNSAKEIVEDETTYLSISCVKYQRSICVTSRVNRRTMLLTVDPTSAMCIDDEIASSEDEPRSLILTR